MSDQDNNHSLLTEKGRLRQENKFLRERLENLETFKQKFFSVQRELTTTREQLLINLEQLNLARCKDRIQVTTEDEGATSSRDGSSEDIIRFFQESFIAASYQDLVEAVFHAVENMGLSLLIQIRYHGKVINFARDVAYREIALDLIHRFSDQGEVVEAEGCLFLSHRYLAMVIGSLPSDSPDENARLKEYLGIIASGANIRVDTLSKKLELDELQGNIYKIFRKVNHSFEDIQNNLDNQIIAISELYLSFEKELRRSVSDMNLSEQQRREVFQIAATFKAELNLMLTSSLTVDENFITIMKKLEFAYAPRNHQI